MQIVKNGQTESINAEMIRVGDIIYLKNEENVPCDAVVLATSYQVTEFFILFRDNGSIT